MILLGKPEIPPYVDENDLIDLAYDLGPGWIATADLYLAYTEMIYLHEKRPPVPKRAFGNALNQAGWRASSRYLNGSTTRCRLITNQWVRRGQNKHGVDPEADHALMPDSKDLFVAADELDHGLSSRPRDSDSLDPPTWE